MEKVKQKPVVLTIAGSDSGAGAGIQADIKTISANGGFAISAITALTAQNTQGVHAIHHIPQDFFEKQLSCLLEDFEVSAIKIGMLANEKIVESVVKVLLNFDKPIVLDTVFLSSSGAKLLSEAGIQLMIEELFPMTELITPNLPEASFLLSREISDRLEMQVAAKELLEKYNLRNVLLKGGHLDSETLVDLFYDGTEFTIFEKKRIQTRNLHGTGCTFSSAIVTNLVKGNAMKKAIEMAENYVEKAILTAKNQQIGKGNGSLAHFF